MTLQEKAKTNFGLYCHVPFCATTCDFCAFYQEKPVKADIKRYLDGISMELAYYKDILPKSVDTFFWGGGTPGLLTASDLEKLGNLLLSAFAHKPLEWSVEMAPSTVKPDKIKALKDLGVNRISMGVQSFQDDLLDALGRRHSAKKVFQAYDIIRNEGFENVNLDLIFSIPGQTLDQLEKDLEQAVALQPEHISTYCLTFEEDTALYVKLSQGKIKRCIENEAVFYEKTWEYLENAGYHQYEISNFSRPGKECKHNVDTWRMQEWLGVGPSASSQFQNRRFTNPFSLDDWLKSIQSNHSGRVDNVDLTDSIILADSIIFGLRMDKGIDLADLRSKYPTVSELENSTLWKGLMREELMIQENDQFKLTLKGKLLVDRIGAEILGIF